MPTGFKRFVKAVHQAGLGVILDVVYNHFGPSDLDLWQFDGWSENGLGGIYFYNDWHAETPWGSTRPDYGRKEVRQFIRDNALMWLEEYHVDGLRLDMTLFMRNVRGDGDPGGDLPDGWSLVQWINREVRRAVSGTHHDRRGFAERRPAHEAGGPGRSGFHGSMGRSLCASRAGCRHHDRATNNGRWTAFAGRSRAATTATRSNASSTASRTTKWRTGKPASLRKSILMNPDSWFAQKRTTLAAALVLTAPGIPMLFQGQEFLEDGWFQDSVPLDWHKSEEFSGLVRMYRDLIHLRLNRFGSTRGLTGSGLNTFHQNQADNVIAYHRWHQGGPGDDVVVVVNLSHLAHENYKLGFPSPGTWRLRLNSDWNGYSRGFGNQACSDVVAGSERRDEPQDPSAGNGMAFPPRERSASDHTAF